jgi:hypothetical protein
VLGIESLPSMAVVVLSVAGAGAIFRLANWFSDKVRAQDAVLTMPAACAHVRGVSAGGGGGTAGAIADTLESRSV